MLDFYFFFSPCWCHKRHTALRQIWKGLLKSWNKITPFLGWGGKGNRLRGWNIHRELSEFGAVEFPKILIDLEGKSGGSGLYSQKERREGCFGIRVKPQELRGRGIRGVSDACQHCHKPCVTLRWQQQAGWSGSPAVLAAGGCPGLARGASIPSAVPLSFQLCPFSSRAPFPRSTWWTRRWRAGKGNGPTLLKLPLLCAALPAPEIPCLTSRMLCCCDCLCNASHPLWLEWNWASQ